MKDIIELAYEIHEKNRKRFGDSETCADKDREEITEALLAELAKEKGADIAQYLTCTYDAMCGEYKIVISLPDRFCYLPKSVDDDVKTWDKINIPDDLDAQIKKANECALQHIKTFRDQAHRGEMADFGEPCPKCIHWGKCNYDWLSNLYPLQRNSDVQISLVVWERTQQLDKDVCGTVKDKDTHHVDKKNE